MALKTCSKQWRSVKICQKNTRNQNFTCQFFNRDFCTKNRTKNYPKRCVYTLIELCYNR